MFKRVDYNFLHTAEGHSDESSSDDESSDEDFEELTSASESEEPEEVKEEVKPVVKVPKPKREGSGTLMRCLLCPAALLLNEKTVDAHRSSKIHMKVLYNTNLEPFIVSFLTEHGRRLWVRRNWHSRARKRRTRS